MLEDGQVLFRPDGEEGYYERVAKAQSPQGLQALGALNLEWDPQTEVLTIHKIKILRGKEVIDVLGQGKSFTVLRRETNLEHSMLDGRLTATLQLEDLRVGDAIDMAITIRHHDPSFNARPERFFFENPNVVVDRFRVRGLWPKDLPVRWRATAGMGEAKVRTLGDQRELTIDMTSAKPPKPPKLAPRRYDEIGQFQISAYRDWTDVSSSLAPLFEKAAKIAPDSPVTAQAALIRAENKTKTDQVSAALRLVEDKVRYVFLGQDLGGYKPTDADLTWSRAFGDCKGKTVLLVGLLRALGMDATPVLVSTQHGDGLDERLPGLGLFDHAIVRLRLDGRTYWLDATRSGDHDLSKVQPPAYRWALPLTPDGSKLEAIDQPPLEEPTPQITLRLDATQGLTAPAPAHAEFILRGDAAIATDRLIHTSTKTDLEKFQKDFWERTFPWITFKAATAAYDADRAEATLTLDGVAQLGWREDDPGTGRRLQLTLTNLGASTEVKRDPDTQQDAPYAVTYPIYSATKEILLLPDHGRGYDLVGRDIDRTVGGVRYHRSTTLSDGVVTSEASTRSLQREFPASEALTTQLGMASLETEAEWVRAPVTYGQSKREMLDDSAINPISTEDYLKRANEMLGKNETDRAIADFDEVIRREPTMAQALVGRGWARVRRGDLSPALDDLDRALKAQPDLLAALAARSEARFLTGRTDEALADAEEIVRRAPTTPQGYNLRGGIHLRSGAAAKAKADYDASLKLNPEDAVALEGRARAYVALGQPDLAKADLTHVGESADTYNERCFSRGMANIALEDALADCNSALALAPAAANILDSRGFIYFRLGRFAEAIADLNSALKFNPRIAESLYIRGLAKRRLGDPSGGKADIAAAKALDANVARTYADYGVKE